jgi:phage terminase small subunit
VPPLKSFKQEKVCQQFVLGFSQAESYANAGYAQAAHHAAQFFARPEIKARVDELAAEIHERARQHMDRYNITREWVLERLIDNAREAYKDRQFAPANQALSLVGKELGMFIERKEIRMTRTLDDLPATDRERLLQAIDDELERRQGGSPGLDAPRQLEGVAD